MRVVWLLRPLLKAREFKKAKFLFEEKMVRKGFGLFCTTNADTGERSEYEPPQSRWQRSEETGRKHGDYCRNGD